MYRTYMSLQLRSWSANREWYNLTNIFKWVENHHLNWLFRVPVFYRSMVDFWNFNPWCLFFFQGRVVQQIYESYEWFWTLFKGFWAPPSRPPISGEAKHIAHVTLKKHNFHREVLLIFCFCFFLFVFPELTDIQRWILMVRPLCLFWKTKTRWWFQIFFYFHPYLGGRFPIWLICFKRVGSTTN